jgi:hypothetical protein
MSACAVVVTASLEVKMRENIIDAIGMIILTGLVIVFGTSLVTEDWNVWALMARFGGAV